MSTAFVAGAFSDAVYTAFKASSSLSGIKVFDGPIVNGKYGAEAIVIGHDGRPIDDYVPMSGSNDYRGLGAQRMSEVGSLECVIHCMPGKTDLKVLRNRAFDILGLIDTVIRSDSSFGNTVLYSGIGQWAQHYVAPNDQQGVKIVFIIEYTGRT